MFFRYTYLKNNTYLLYNMDIPLKNKNKEIVAYTKVSIEDYHSVIQYNWYRHSSKATRIYVVGTVNGKRTSLHKFIIGDAGPYHVIDHINNDTLDNRRENLRIVTVSQNNQNKRSQANSSSQYIGVYFDKQHKKWVASHSNTRIVTLTNEVHAAKEYDKYIINLYGKDVKTNFPINSYPSDELKIAKLLKPKKQNLLYTSYDKKREKYRSRINFNKVEYLCGYYDTELEAHFAGNKKKIQLEKEKRALHFSQKIIYNEAKIPIITPTNKNAVGDILVDEDKWHDLSLYTWRVTTDGYAQANVNGKITLMHRYLMRDKPILHKCIDHINQNKLDNRLSNLRIVCKGINNQNKSKRHGCSSKYIGVSTRDNKVYKMQINHKGKYYISHHNSEIEAAKAYNKKAVELYGQYASLNTVIET